MDVDVDYGHEIKADNIDENEIKAVESEQDASKEDLFHFDKTKSRVESGFIAQEVEQIEELKHLVYTQNDKLKLKSINYNGIIPYNTRAIREFKLQNDELEKRRIKI